MKRLLFLLLSVSINGIAQNYDADSIHYTRIERPKTKKSEDISSKFVEYFFNVQTGTLIGCNDCAKGKEVTFSFATTHGVTVGKKFRGGLGVGFDSYENWQTIPLYALASWDLIGNKTKNAVYLQVAYGWAHPWFVRNGSYQYYLSDPYSYVSGGEMFNPSLGYRIKYYNLRLAFIAGYKFQRIFYKNSYDYFPCANCDYFTPPDITQDMNRVQLMISVGWK